MIDPKLKQNGPLTIVDNILHAGEIEELDDWFGTYLSWGLGYDMQEYGAKSATLCRSLQWDMWIWKHQLIEDTRLVLRKRLKEYFDLDIPYFQRCLINNFKFGDSPMWHKDAPSNKKALTMMVYPNKVWDLNWGGYTAFGWGSEDADWVALPKPGRVVLFPGNINHCGIAPTKIHEGYGRFSMAYQDANDNAPVMDPSLLRKSESQKVIKQVSYEEGKKTRRLPEAIELSATDVYEYKESLQKDRAKIYDLEKDERT